MTVTAQDIYKLPKCN